MSSEKKLQDDLNEILGDTKEHLKKAADQVSKKTAILTEEAKEKASEFADETKEVYQKISGENRKVLAGVTAILLGGFGVHKFILGYYKQGIILLILTLCINIFGLGFFGLIVWFFSLTEGVIYLSKTNDEFFKTYQENKKYWL